MLREETLFGMHDLVEVAILRIKEFEKKACSMHEDGYWVAFSGGKDSIVVLDLVRRAGVKHTAHFNVTTVDPPELLEFMREHYPDVRRERPRISMFKLIQERMMPPTRIIRYCCRELKERGGKDRVVITGVRWGESAKRSKRKIMEACFRSSRKFYLNPIVEWSDEDVWQYIRERKLPYCRLYDEGFTRIGCVGCPMTGDGRLKEFARWPKFEKMYRRAFEGAALALHETDRGRARLAGDGGLCRAFTSGDAMWEWWMRDGAITKTEDSDQGVLFE